MKYIQENELKVEKINSGKLKLKNENIKILKYIIQKELKIINKEIRKTY